MNDATLPAVVGLVLGSLVARPVRADEPAPPTSRSPAGPGPAVTIGGYVEAFYQAHVQNPTNQITNLRGFDNRSRTFTLSNVALDIAGKHGRVEARIMLQVGHTPSTYYLAEPVSPAAGSSANASDAGLWKHLQTAMLAYHAPHDITIMGGLFSSPVGIEAIPIKDNWNWSRSNLFFGLPFYHTGLQVHRPLVDGWTAKLHVYNGWNSVVDNNPYPSAGLSAGYASATTAAQVLYLGGVERPTGAPEGQGWRHLLDAIVQHALTDELTVAAQLDVGLEPNDLATSGWFAVAVYGKLAFSDRLYAAVRGDYFYERVAERGGVAASAIFWPTPWLASATATLAYQPAGGLSLRFEVRHDHAGSPTFFGGTVAGDGVLTPFVPDRAAQDTVTLGATAWF